MTEKFHLSNKGHQPIQRQSTYNLSTMNVEQTTKNSDLVSKKKEPAAIKEEIADDLNLNGSINACDVSVYSDYTSKIEFLRDPSRLASRGPTPKPVPATRKVNIETSDEHTQNTRDLMVRIRFLEEENRVLKNQKAADK